MAEKNTVLLTTRPRNVEVLSLRVTLIEIYKWFIK